MARSSSIEAAHQAWQDCLAGTARDVREQVGAIVDRDAPRLAQRFYDELLGDADARVLIDHAIVNERLHASLVRWLRELFVAPTTVEDAIATQQRTGAMHARMGVPMRLVSRAARVIKRSIVASLPASSMSRAALATSVQYVFELVDLAIDTMNEACESGASRLVRADEAYRLFFLGQNLRAERERQNSRLLEWANDVLVRYYWDVEDTSSRAAAGESQFVLWLEHKAATLFEGAPEIAQIRAHVATIERELLPRLTGARGSHGDARLLVGTISRRVDEIRRMLGAMFDRFIEAEDGRDPVTRLLNRRFFASVVKREIALAQAGDQRFALLLVDIDRFSALRDVLGVDGSDQALAQIGETLAENVRAGDFVFRIGDDQFLVLLVETTQARAMPVAEGLRALVAALPIRAPERATTTATVSIGVSLFDGHPDYQRLLDRAQQALARAKQAGGNCCELHG